MGLTKLIRREVPHLTGLVIDGFIWTMIPTLTFLASDETISPFTRKCYQATVIFLGALSGFRSKAFGDWKDGKRQRDETERVAKVDVTATIDSTKIDPEGHLR
jgi:hypothetical protein